MVTMMEVDTSPPFLPEGNEPDEWIHFLRNIRNDVIGSNRQKKKAAIETKIIPPLLGVLDSDSRPEDVKVEAAVILGSLAKGPTDIVQLLVDNNAVQILLRGTRISNKRYFEACLRCLRTILSVTKNLSSVIFEDPSLVDHFISIINESSDTKECVATIFANCCATQEHQQILRTKGAVLPLVFIMATNNYRVQMPALRALCALCYRNRNVSIDILECEVSDRGSVEKILDQLQGRDKSTEMQMAAAKCLTYIYRAGAPILNPNLISLNTLQMLVYMCKPDKTWEERVEAAETLAYLIEVDVHLQNIAAISNHIIKTLAEYFKYPGSPPDAALMPTKKDDITVGNELRQAAFRAYASLCANSEEVRKKVIDTDNIMNHIVNGLNDAVVKVQVAAIRCLHSLSRSVQQLRTSFIDQDLWKSVTATLCNSKDDTVLSVTTAVLCNLLLEFSPNKELILEECVAEDDGCGIFQRRPKVVVRLLELTRHSSRSIQLNAVWALMNATFNLDASAKSRIVGCLQNDDLFHLVELLSSYPEICLKTLGTIRNLLSSMPNPCEEVMARHGQRIMESVVFVLESEGVIEVKEQALCILTNIANSSSDKCFILGNEDVLQKIFNYLKTADERLQVASLCCIHNLLRNVERDQRRELDEKMKIKRELEKMDEAKNSNRSKILSESISATLELLEDD